jgi:hypothetical protein
VRVPQLLFNLGTVMPRKPPTTELPTTPLNTNIKLLKTHGNALLFITATP